MRLDGDLVETDLLDRLLDLDDLPIDVDSGELDDRRGDIGCTDRTEQIAGISSPCRDNNARPESESASACASSSDFRADSIRATRIDSACLREPAEALTANFLGTK